MAPEKACSLTPCRSLLLEKRLREVFMRKLNLIGQKFGRLTVIAKVPSKSNRHSRWKCLCDCGNITEVDSNNLTSGGTVSCGCFRRTILKKHGQSGTYLYSVWESMRRRCNTPSNGSFKYYGHLGVSITAEWESFEDFAEWALSHGFKEGLSIDRIDPNGNYCPENCRWIPLSDQAKTRRNCHNFRGKNLVDWCKETGIKVNTVYSRLSRGWTLEKALFTPSDRS